MMFSKSRGVTGKGVAPPPVVRAVDSSLPRCGLSCVRVERDKRCREARRDGDDAAINDHGENPKYGEHDVPSRASFSHNHPSGRLNTPLGVFRLEVVRRPISIALVNDYDVVVVGLAHLFDGYRDRIVVAELATNKTVLDDVDIVLYDSFAQPEADHDDIKVLINSPHARRVVVYTWNFHPQLIESAMSKGASGYLSKMLPAHELVDALGGDPLRSDHRQRSTAEVADTSWT